MVRSLYEDNIGFCKTENVFLFDLFNITESFWKGEVYKYSEHNFATVSSRHIRFDRLGGNNFGVDECCWISSWLITIYVIIV